MYLFFGCTGDPFSEYSSFVYSFHIPSKTWGKYFESCGDYPTSRVLHTVVDFNGRFYFFLYLCELMIELICLAGEMEKVVS
jgi:hypothetical protein